MVRKMFSFKRCLARPKEFYFPVSSFFSVLFAQKKGATKSCQFFQKLLHPSLFFLFIIDFFYLVILFQRIFCFILIFYFSDSC